MMVDTGPRFCSLQAPPLSVTLCDYSHRLSEAIPMNITLNVFDEKNENCYDFSVSVYSRTLIA